MLPSSTLLDPSSFVNSPPVLIRSILRHASRLSPPTHAESFHKHSSGAKLCRSAAVRLPLLQHVPPTRHGERYCTWPASMRGISARQTECPIDIANQHYTHSLLHCTFVASMSDRNHSIMAHPERPLPNPHLLNNSAVITGIIHERTPRAPRHFSTKSPRTDDNFGRHCIVYGRLVRPRGKAYVQRQRHLAIVS